MENQEVSKVSVDLLWTSISPPEIEKDKMCVSVCVCVCVTERVLAQNIAFCVM